MHLLSILPPPILHCHLLATDILPPLALRPNRVLWKSSSPCPCIPFTPHTLVSGTGSGVGLSGLEDDRVQGHHALTDVVKASRGQALWQVRRVEERGQEGHGRVLLVVQDSFVLCALPGHQEQLQAFRETSGLEGRPCPLLSPGDISEHVYGWIPQAKALTSSGLWLRKGAFGDGVSRIPILTAII